MSTTAIDYSGMALSPDTFPEISHWKGPILAGFILTSILYGVCIGNFTTYIQLCYSTDRRGTKTLVWAVSAVATLTMVYSVLFTVRTFAIQFGRVPNTDDAKWDSVSYACGGVTHVLVAGFFARRAYLMYGRPLYMAIGFIAVMTLTAVGSIGATTAHIIAPFGERTQLDVIFNYLMFTGQMITDVVVTGCIVAKLRKSKTGWKSTDTMIGKLVMISIETQLPPSIMAICFLVTFITAPYGSYILAFQCFPMLYVAGLLAALNSRYTISAKMESEKRDELPSRRTLPSIHVNTETYIHMGHTDYHGAEKKHVVERGAGRRVDSSESLQSAQEDNKDLNTSEVRLV